MRLFEDAVLGVAILNPVLIALAAAVGAGICKATGTPLHPHELLMAAITALIASELSLIPRLLKKDDTPVSNFQAGLFGTMIHLALSIFLGLGVVLTVKPNTAFIWWLMPMYWVTLIGLCTVFVRAMRSPVTSNTVGSNTTATN